MKVTDYCPRAAPFDSYLKGRNLVGVEIGVDVGAHAEALLRYRDVAMIHLVDIWPNPYCHGYCEGRLAQFRARYSIHGMTSHKAAERFFAESCRAVQDSGGAPMFDFIYIDQEHDERAVAGDLAAWWRLLRVDGVLGYRNYTGRGTPLDRAVDAFIAEHRDELEPRTEEGEIVLFKNL